MKLKWRMLVGIVILVLSLSLLAWGFWPEARVRQVLPIQPSNLTLPTPSSFQPMLFPFS